MLVRVLPIIPRVKSVYRRTDSYLPKITNNIKMSTIDDIESLMKSMRREAYRYAREFRAAFIVVHVDVSEEECWMRNSRRDDGDVLKVPREAFERLAAAFDRPGKGGYDADEAFDKNYVVVKPPKKGSGGGSGNDDRVVGSHRLYILSTEKN